MKKIEIFCDGGLGNRIGSLIGGIYLAEKNNIPFKINWPKTNWCSCLYTDLFENEYENCDFELTKIITEEKIISVTHILHEFNNKDVVFISPEETKNINLNDYDANKILYGNNLPISYMEEEDILNCLKKLKIKKEILQIVDDYVSKNFENRIVYGLHLRNTDGPVYYDFDLLFNQVKNNMNGVFFICSDNQETENKFLELKNVITYKKNNYVEKLDEQSEWDCNVYRSSQSVIDGFIDMLILSKTRILTPDNFSTFLKFAKLYNKININ